jgi:hypothetical protein
MIAPLAVAHSAVMRLRAAIEFLRSSVRVVNAITEQILRFIAQALLIGVGCSNYPIADLKVRHNIFTREWDA